MDRHAEAVCDGERCKTMPLRLRSGGAVGRRGADPCKHGTGKPVGDIGHETIESASELLAGYRRQDHSVVRLTAAGVDSDL